MKRLLLATAAMVALATPAAALTFTYTGAIESWIVPTTGTYEIIAIGAQGGAGTSSQIWAGGRGALIGGMFDLMAGTTLQLAVGGMGGSALGNGGGGGGSFVVGPGATPLVIAGGGGGIRWLAEQSGWDANTGQAGLSGSDDSATGGGAELLSLIGQGGPAGLFYGSGGGGFNSAGANDSPYGTGGASWAGGLAGGVDNLVGLGCDTAAGGDGGFGGGGAGAGCWSGGGGGGGYSGGQGGFIAGGGGSFNADVLTGWSRAGAGVGNGSISINLVEPVATPEPASAALAVLGLFALAAVRRRR